MEPIEPIGKDFLTRLKSKSNDEDLARFNYYGTGSIDNMQNSLHEVVSGDLLASSSGSSYFSAESFAAAAQRAGLGTDLIEKVSSGTNNFTQEEALGIGQAVLLDMAGADGRLEWNVDANSFMTQTGLSDEYIHKLVTLKHAIAHDPNDFTVTAQQLVNFNPASFSAIAADNSPRLRTAVPGVGGVSGPSPASLKLMGISQMPTAAAAIPAASNMYAPESRATSTDPLVQRALNMQGQAMWITNGANVGEFQRELPEAIAKGETLTAVLYNMVNRDNGGYSAGGASSEQDYMRMVQQVSDIVGDSEMIMILEPDTTGFAHNSNNYSKMQLMTQAARHFQENNPNMKVFADAANPAWMKAGEIVDVLSQRDTLNYIDGFAINIAQFQTDSANLKLAEELYAITGLPSIADSSRNGNGDPGGGPHDIAGIGLGTLPTFDTGSKALLANLWIKKPFASDGRTAKDGAYVESRAREILRNTPQHILDQLART